MSLLKKVFKGAKKLVKNPGGWAKSVGKQAGKAWEAVDDYALPAIGFALGGPAGAALGSAGARAIGNGRFDPRATLLAGAKGYAGGALASGLGLAGGKGFGALGSSARGAIANPGQLAMSAGRQVLGVPGPAGAGAVPAAGASGAAASQAAGPSVLDRVFGAVGKYGPGLLQAGIAGYGAVEGAKQQRAGEAMQKRALDLAFQQYNEAAPIRERQRQLLLRGPAPPPDFTSLYRSSANPWG